MKRKPTPAQIAARERFAEMARSGAFKRKAKRNPAKKTVSQKISQLTREGYPQKQAVAIALSEERAGKVKRNPSDYRFEIRRANKAQTLDSVYATLSQAKNALDEIDRPPASFFLVDTQTGKHYFSFQAETKLPMVELRATAMQKAYKRNPRASNPIILVSDKPKRVTRKSNPTGRPATLKRLIRKDFKPGMTVYQVQYRQPGMQSFEPWATVMDLEVAKDTARRLADGYRDLGWTWKVESIEVQIE